MGSRGLRPRPRRCIRVEWISTKRKAEVPCASHVWSWAEGLVCICCGKQQGIKSETRPTRFVIWSQAIH